MKIWYPSRGTSLQAKTRNRAASPAPRGRPLPQLVGARHSTSPLTRRRFDSRPPYAYSAPKDTEVAKSVLTMADRVCNPRDPLARGLHHRQRRLGVREDRLIARRARRSRTISHRAQPQRARRQPSHSLRIRSAHRRFCTPMTGIDVFMSESAVARKLSCTP